MAPDDVPPGPAPAGRLSAPEYWEANWRVDESHPHTPLVLGRLDLARRELLDRLRRAARRSGGPSARVLEVGCGGGEWLAALAADHACRAHGVDYSEAGCRQAVSALQAAGAADARVWKADAFDFVERQPEAFDLVYSLGFVEHFEDPAEPLAMHARLARRGGLVFVAVPYLRGLWGRIARRTSPEAMAAHTLLDPGMLRRAALACGLVPLDAGLLGPHRLGGGAAGGRIPGLAADVALVLAWQLSLPLGGRRWAGWIAHYAWLLALKPA